MNGSVYSVSSYVLMCITVRVFMGGVRGAKGGGVLRISSPLKT